MHHGLGGVEAHAASASPDGVRIAMEAEKELALPPVALPVECKESDDILYITILNKAGGDAA